MPRVKFRHGTSAEFNQAEKDENTLYFLSDTHELYKGDKKYLTNSGLEWEPVGTFEPVDYLTFTGDNLEFKIYENNGVNKAIDGKLYASVDNGIWERVLPGDILSGNTIKMAGRNNTHMYYYDEAHDNEYYLFDYINGENCVVSGKLLSVLDTDTNVAQMANECFIGTFANNSAITDTSELIFPDYTVDNCYCGLFSGCTSLISAPELPATILADSCYQYMFSGCTSLIAPPELPATTLGNVCYSYMFSGCTSLTIAPELPATTLTVYCYDHMFENCTSIITAPELRATTLDGNCYSSMFCGCTSLTTSTELLATTLKSYCYSFMFQNCTSLTEAPELASTSLAAYCYCSMFEGCTSLVEAPDLPATVLMSYCYQDMFNGCTSLSEIHLAFTGAFSTTYFSNWVNNVATTGTLYYSGEDTTIGASAIPVNWTVKLDISPDNYLTFTGDNLSFTLSNTKTWDHSLYYSYDLNEWYRANVNTTISGNTFYLAGNNTRLNNTNTNSTVFKSITGSNCSISGNLRLALLSNTLTPSTYTFVSLFSTGVANTTIVDASQLILDLSTLTSYCYTSMFYYCTALTAAPVLSTTTLANYCCRYMFQGCISLVVPPALSATTLANSCYNGMFAGCASLAEMPELPATTLFPNCYDNMFGSCTSLTTVHDLPATTLANSCYRYMFYNCNSLVAAPKILATTLATGCFSNMFQNCAKLNEINISYTGAFSSTYFAEWVKNVASTGNFYYSGTAVTRGISAIPVNWTIAVDVNPTNYLTFTGNNLSFTFGSEKTWSGKLYYSYDLLTWRIVNAGTVISGNTFYLAGNNTSLNSVTYYTYCCLFSNISGSNCAISGNLSLALLGENVSPGAFTFAKLFSLPNGNSNTTIVDLSQLILGYAANSYSYYRAFMGCVNLVYPPIITETTIYVKPYMFQDAFADCTSLTTTPDLSKIIVEPVYGNYCFLGMFADCTSLTNITQLPSLSTAEHCYHMMFSNCTSLTIAPDLPATALNKNCYTAMFNGCTALISAPILPATVLATGCYTDMFKNCSMLAEIHLAYTGNFDSSFADWVSGVASTGTLYYSGTDTTRGNSAIPTNWTVQPYA